jgi:hypothetical protein
MIAIMNIQQYMTPEILGPLTFLSVLFVALLSSIQIKKIQEISEHYEHEDEEEDVKYEAHMEKPNAGQTWYHRVSFNCPWPVMGEESAPPVKILQVRGDWLQFGDNGLKTTMGVKKFCSLYMRDEFNDFKEMEGLIPEKTEEEPLPEKSEKEELTAAPEFNVIKIHGEDFVLTPVEKKNDQ